MKNRSQRYDIKRPRPRHGHKYSKYEMCLSIMMEAQFITKSRNTQAELKKSVAYEKSLYIENEKGINKGIGYFHNSLSLKFFSVVHGLQRRI